MSAGTGTPPSAVRETHCAYVFLVGDRAYKLKKPVDLGFLDFSTRERRERACRRELELNRRLSPDVYLGVSDVVGTDGEACDHLVVMRRMPDDRRLGTLLVDGADVSDCLTAVARQVAALHAVEDTSLTRPEIGAVATRDAVAGNWTDNFDTIQRSVPDVVAADDFNRAQRLALRYLEGRAGLFDQRVRKGMVRDGHGDLLAEDIFCLDDGPRILDCLDFDDRYRYGDVLLDAAFLAMDLERLGHPDAAARFLARYLEFSGEHHPDSLLHHYVAYRAHVRVKVACLRAAQGDGDAALEARRLHRVVIDHLERGRVVLALVGGLPGTGKSTVAAGLSDAMGWALLRSDELRKDMARLGHHEDAHARYGEELYRTESVTAVYDELLRRAGRLLELGVSVVLDASWTAAAHRRPAFELADATHADRVQLRCEAPLEVARARLVSRVPGGDASDATLEVLDAMSRRADAWADAATVRTQGPIDAVLARARDAVRDQLG